jgi:hypothetical protein
MEYSDVKLAGIDVRRKYASSHKMRFLCFKQARFLILMAIHSQVTSH